MYLAGVYRSNSELSGLRSADSAYFPAGSRLDNAHAPGLIEGSCPYTRGVVTPFGQVDD